MNKKSKKELLKIIEKLEAQNCELISALSLIAAPVRSDGTWNRERLACQKLAQKTLSNTKNS